VLSLIFSMFHLQVMLFSAALRRKTFSTFKVFGSWMKWHQKPVPKVMSRPILMQKWTYLLHAPRFTYSYLECVCMHPKCTFCTHLFKTRL